MADTLFESLRQADRALTAFIADINRFMALIANLRPAPVLPAEHKEES